MVAKDFFNDGANLRNAMQNQCTCTIHLKVENNQVYIVKSIREIYAVCVHCTVSHGIIYISFHFYRMKILTKVATF